MLSFLALLGLARAGVDGTDVLWYDGNGGYDPTSAGLASIESTLLAAGATSFAVDSTWPSSLEPYRVLFVCASTTNFDAAQTADLEAFLDDDGVLVLVAEYYPFQKGHVTVLNTLVADLGGTSSFGSEKLDTSCSSKATPVTSHDINDGVSSLKYGGSTSITVGSAGIEVFEGVSGQAMVVAEDNLVLAADTQLFTDSCSPSSGNEVFWENLFDYMVTCDADGDGYETSSYGCAADDCDDDDADVHPGAPETCNAVDDDCDGDTNEDAVDAPDWYLDGDGDGYGAADDVLAECDQPSGYVGNDDDCDDDDAAISPVGSETPYDGVDDDCDGSDLTDVDGDGWDASAVGGRDCHDGDATIRPGATEKEDGIDNDCDGTIDEGTGSYDDDGDGFTEDGGDCDDTDPDLSPGAPELDNGIDDDCDGTTDEGTWGYDDDGDGFTEEGGDCDDTDAGAYPGGTETANGVDDDCDGTADEGTDAWDDDGDGFTEEGGDCDDTDAAVHPGAAEDEDGVDQDCDGDVDDGTAAFDDDGDGYSEDAGDCDDDDAGVHPGASEHVNGVDDDCDGEVDTDSDITDDDGDGLSEADGDCDDTDRAVFPGATETDNGVDDDCDGTTDEGSAATDDDGDGYSEDEGDCDDATLAVHPGATELCTPEGLDAVDEDCDGQLDESCELVGEEDDAKGGGCGCAAGGGGGGLLALLVPVAVLARRRRGRALPLAAGLALGGCTSDVQVAARSVSTHVVADDLWLDFGAVTAGGRATGAVDVRNAGQRSVTATRARVDPEGAFTLLSEPGSVELGKAGSGTDYLEVEVAFSPSEAALYEAAVVVDLAADDQLTVDVPLFGLGVEPALIFIPPVVDVGAVSGAADATVTLLNQGAAPVTLASLGSDDAGVGVDADVADLVLEPEDSLGFTVTVDATGPLEGSVTLTLAEGGTATLVVRANVCDDTTPPIDEDGDGFTACGGDCDDADSALHPAAREALDGVDNDCDGVIDEGTAASDDDGDGWSEDDGDCDDTDPDAYPGSTVAREGVDMDCDGELAGDLDGDGFTEVGGDCDDSDPLLHPGALETLDGVDEDCDGDVDEGTSAFDDDGDGYSEADGDCHDGDPTVRPGGTESADGVDEDCDGSVDEGTSACDDDGDGFTESGGDCDDADDSVSPAAWDTPGDGVDSDCDGSD